ncbi:MAG: hypothetical protein WCN92_07650, partial [Eubacteriales bacterium]
IEYLQQTYPEKKPSVITKDIYTAFVAHKKPVEVPKTESEIEETYDVSPSIKKREKIETKMKIRKQFIHENRKISINDWVTYYFDRYNRLRDILQNREELKNTISIGRAIKSTEGSGRQQVSLIGMIKSLRKALSGTRKANLSLIKFEYLGVKHENCISVISSCSCGFAFYCRNRLCNAQLSSGLLSDFLGLRGCACVEAERVKGFWVKHTVLFTTVYTYYINQYFF